MAVTGGSRVQVLVADPDVIGRSATRKIVASRGLSVAEAASRELALRWLAEVGPRLLVLDHALGDELLKQVVTLYPKLEVVFVCREQLREQVQDDIRDRGLSSYVKDLWVKPLDPRRVAAVLKSVFPELSA